MFVVKSAVKVTVIRIQMQFIFYTRPPHCVLFFGSACESLWKVCGKDQGRGRRSKRSSNCSLYVETVIMEVV